MRATANSKEITDNNMKMTTPETYVDGFHDKLDVEKMEYSPLGNTGMQVSKLGIGGGAFGDAYGKVDDSEVANVLENGLKQGINYIDTSPFYGTGKSETVIGKVLKNKNIPRKSFYISTKVGRYQYDWGTIDYSKERVQKSVNESLERLGLTYVDIIIVHDVEFADKKQVLDETLPALAEMVKQGKIKFIGLSAYPLSAKWEIIEESKVPIDVIMTYARDTLTDSTLNDYMPRLIEKGIGVITASPTGCQLITNKGPERWHPAGERLRKLCKEAADYCKDNNVELGTLAVSHALESPNTTVCLVGMINSDIMKQNLKLLFDGLSPVEQDVLNYLKKKVFNQKENLHWEGVELAKCKKHLESIGRSTTHL